MKKYFLILLLLIISASNLVSEEYVKCKVLNIETIKNVNNSGIDFVKLLKVKILNGRFKDQIVLINNYYYDKNHKFYTIESKEGDILIARLDVSENKIISGAVAFYYRSNKILPVLIFFIIASLAILRKKGIKSILALILVIALIILFFILLKYGIPPLTLAIVVSFLSAFITFLFVLKDKLKLLTAYLSILSGLIFILFFSFVIFKISSITGLNTSEGRMLKFFSQNIKGFNLSDIKTFFISGILIFSLGSLMDVSAAIASSLVEIKKSKPDIKFKQIIKSGFSVAKDIIGTMTNTLIFVSLSNIILLLLIFYIMKTPFHRFTNFEFFLLILLPGLIGSIGMIITILAGIFVFGIIIKLENYRKFKKIFIPVLSAVLFLFLANNIFAWVVLPDFDMNVHPITKIFKAREYENYEIGKIINIEPYIKKGMNYSPTLQKIKIKVLTGEFKGQKIEFQNYLWGDKENDFLTKKSEKVLVWLEKRNGKILNAYIADRYRFFVIYYLLILFGILLILFAKWLGLKIFSSILISAFLIISIFVPLTAKGYNIIFITFGTAFIIIFTINLFLFKNKIMFLSSIAGCLSGAFISYIMAFLLNNFFKITGFSLEYMQQLNYFNVNFNLERIKNLPSLLYTIIIFSSTGALIDMGITISTTLNEIYNLNPSIPFKNLFRHGMEVGTDVAGTMINTLILAYIGSNLAFILSWLIGATSMLQLLNIEVLYIELVKSISATLGMLFVIPVTSFIYAYSVNRKQS